MDDRFNLQRFVVAQELVIDSVLQELSAGAKRSHWMWFVFPQIAGLGFSATARKFAISGLEEAQAYLEHEVLGARLRECAQLVLEVEGRSVQQIFRSPDDMKFCSSLTLFSEVSKKENLFDKALEKYFNGTKDELTLKILNEQQG